MKILSTNNAHNDSRSKDLIAIIQLLRASNLLPESQDTNYAIKDYGMRRSLNNLCISVFRSSIYTTKEIEIEVTSEKLLERILILLRLMKKKTKREVHLNKKVLKLKCYDKSNHIAKFEKIFQENPNNFVLAMRSVSGSEKELVQLIGVKRNRFYLRGVRADGTCYSFSIPYDKYSEIEENVILTFK